MYSYLYVHRLRSAGINAIFAWLTDSFARRSAKARPPSFQAHSRVTNTERGHRLPWRTPCAPCRYLSASFNYK